MNKEKIIRIKRSRYKPEELYLMDLIDGMYIIQQTKSPNNVFWEKNNKIIFEQETQHDRLKVNYNLIWKVVGEKYDLTYIDVCKLMKKILIQYNINFYVITTF